MTTSFFTLGERSELEVGHVDQRRLEAELARGLGDIARELLGVAGLGRVEDGQRLGRLRRRGRLRVVARRRRCASMPARKPASQARCIGVAGPTTRLRTFDLLLGEGGSLRDGGGGP